MAKKNRHPITGCRVDSLFEDVWLIGSEQLNARVQQVLKIDLNELIKQNHEVENKTIEADEGTGAAKPKLPYEMVGNVAVMTISGLTTKYPTSFSSIMGGTSTLEVQSALRHALANDDVHSVMLHVDSCPGGNAGGAFDLAEDIRRINAVKPVMAHIDDQGTSAAMLFTSQARWTSANRNAQVGSIGVVTKLVDTSKAYDAQGVKVIPIIAGKMKGIGMEGVKISDTQVAEIERNVADLNEVFVEYVSRGRGLTAEAIKKLEARTFISDRAKNHGLIDEVCQFDVALSNMRKGKIPEAVTRGPAPENIPNPAAARSRVMLKPEQLTQAKSLPGAAHITAENADEVLLQSCSSMVQRNDALEKEVGDLRKLTVKAPKIDAKLAEGHVKLFMGNLDLQVKEGKLLPAQRDVIKMAVNPADGQYAVDLVQPDGTVLLPGDVILKLSDQNKPTGVDKDLTGSQPAPRSEPGGTQEAKMPSMEAVNDQRAVYNLPPITREDYRKSYAPPQAK